MTQYAKPTTDGRAIASVALGVVGVTVGLLLWFIPVPAVLAIACGYSALQRIRTTGAAGSGLARAGIITGIIGLGISLLFLALTLFALFARTLPPTLGAP